MSPYTFRIHKGGVPAQDWTKIANKIDINSIPDALQKGKSAKIGSSIPSPFARMYLFDTAFQMVVKSNAFDFTTSTNMYQMLVSDCLDMFQFLFDYADDPDFTVKIWDVNTRLSNLKNSVHPEHKDLGEALQLFFNAPLFNQTKQIYLFYYKTKLIGGTSPITGLYTSPNWKKIVANQEWQFKTTKTDVLFDSDACAIQDRNEDFVLFMYRWVYANKNTIAQTSKALWDYFINVRKIDNNLNQLLTTHEIGNNYSIQDLTTDYVVIDKNINNNNVSLYSGSLALMKPNPIVIIIKIQQSDFLLRPTAKYYQNYKNANGALQTLEIPLALTNNAHQLKYIDNVWDTKTNVFSAGNPLPQRSLPGFSHIKYPFLTTSDFLQDAIIQLPFAMDNQNFITGSQGDFKFLLPIKKEYFNFFGISDLEEQLTVVETDRTINVQLDLPIKGGTITFNKSYDKGNEDEVIKPQQAGEGFQIGFFPFYKVTNTPKLNQYAVMLLSNMDESVDLKFYRFPDIALGQAVNARTEKRSQKSDTNDIASTYFHIDAESFDCVEVQYGQYYKGMVIPKLKQIDTSKHVNQFEFAIDFGTSNTHIAFTNNRPDQPIETFKIEESDQQMVLLSKKSDNKNKDTAILEGLGTFRTSSPVLNSEFLPSFISKGSANSFPIRTSTCEDQTFQLGGSQLFSKINIGFALETESSSLSNYQYHTNLKWAFRKNKTGAASRRIEAFFRELLWLIKNKIILNQGIIQGTELITMSPLSMNKLFRNQLNGIWKNELNSIFGTNTINHKHISESVAPYYSLVNKMFADTLNIDIGGGTSDLFFVYRSTELFFSSSFQFAGNDIWGDGIIANRDKNNNAFLSLINNQQGIDQLTMLLYKNFKNVPTLDSADVCSFLFSKDKDFRFTEKIFSNQYLRTVLFIHLSAVLYYISKLIDKQDIALPQIITFTGKGSEYVKLIIGNNQNDISELTFSMLSIFSEKDIHANAQVILSGNPKEYTAEGALKEKTVATNNKIPKKVANINYLSPSTDQISLTGIKNIEPEIEAVYHDFLQNLKSNEVTTLMRDFDLSFSYKDFNMIDFLKAEADQSFRAALNIKAGLLKPDDPIDEPPFFWYLKDALYLLTQQKQTTDE